MNKSNKQQQLLDELTSKFEACNVVKNNSPNKPACGVKAKNLKNNNTGANKTRFFHHLLRSTATNKNADLLNVDEYDVPWDSSRLNLETLTAKQRTSPPPSYVVSKSVGSQSSSTDDSGIYEPPWDSGAAGHSMMLLQQRLSQTNRQPPHNQDTELEQQQDNDNGSPPSFFDICGRNGQPAPRMAEEEEEELQQCCSLCSLDKSPKAVDGRPLRNGGGLDDDKSSKSNSSRSSGSLRSAHFDNASHTSSVALKIANDKAMNTSLYIKHSPDRNSDHLFMADSNCTSTDDNFQFRRDLAVQKLCDEVAADGKCGGGATRGTLSTFSRIGTLVNVPPLIRSLSTVDKTRTVCRRSKEGDDEQVDENVYDVPWEFSSKKSAQLGNNVAGHKARSQSQSSTCCQTGPQGQSFVPDVKNKEAVWIGNHSHHHHHHHHHHRRSGRKDNGCPQTILACMDHEMWYHGNINRQEAESRLENSANGSYLVRCCENSSDASYPEYALSLKSPQGYLHMKIQLNERLKWVLGYYSCPFETISSMISYYTTNKLPVKGAEHICLYQCVPRKYT